MSYILDALKKSERERKRASIPDPLAVQDSVLPARRSRGIRSALTIGILLMVTLISGLVFGLWYAQRTSGREELMNQALQSVQTQSRERHAAGDNPDPHADEVGRVPQQEMTQTKKVSVDTLNRQPDTQGRDYGEQRSAASKQEGAESSPPAARSEPEPDSQIPPPEINRLYSLEELPVSLRRKLPDFTVSVFLYSDDPATRILRVNGITMREGQQAPDGLRLEEIVPDGAVFNYMNYRFRVDLP